MSESPRTAPTRLALEALEVREMPAFGLDPTFGIGGLTLAPVGPAKFAFVAASSAAPGDKSVIVGNLAGPLAYGTGGDLAVVRLTPAGAADPQFGGGDGLATFSFDVSHQVVAVATSPDGKILVAGLASPTQGTPSDAFVLRLNADGSRDTSFGKNWEVALDIGGSDSVRRVIVQADGKILLAGATMPAPGGSASPPTPPHLVLERLTANGTPDATFGTAGKVIGAAESGAWATGALAVQPDGKIVVGGTVGPNYSSTASSPNTEINVLRFNANGTPDTTFGTAGHAATHYDAFYYSYAFDLALLGDGRIVVGGASSYGQGLLAWFSPGGALISQEQQTFEDGGLQSIDKVTALPQGGVEVIGFSGVGTTLEYHAAPGSATDVRVVSALPNAVSLGAGGKLLLPGVMGD